FQDITDSYGEDADVSPNDVYNYEQANDVVQLSQEFRLSWETGRTRNILGLYYLNIDGEYDTRQTGDAFFGTGVGYPAGTAEVVEGDQQTETVAIFGQTDISLAEEWTLTVGGRVNHDSKDFDYHSTDIYFIQGGDFSYQDSISETDWSGKLQVSYRPKDAWLFFAGVSRGIKSGGFNLPLFPLATSDFPYDGETLLAYEVGMKADLTDKVRFNASAFYYDYSDYQAYSFDGFATFLFNANATATGAEFEEELDLERMEPEVEVFDVNLLGMVKTVAAVVPLMVRRGSGHFIGLSSIADGVLSPEAPSYYASKAGFTRYLECLAPALRRRGVYVTNVRFGFVDTKMAKGRHKPLLMPPERAAQHLVKCIERKPVSYTAPRVMGLAVLAMRWKKRLEMFLFGPARVR
ncbi:MAG: TonB-dependent receptor, partial [bacterium]